MSEEQRVKRAKGLFSEYLSAADLKEAVACAQEITTPGELSTTSDATAGMERDCSMCLRPLLSLLEVAP